MIIHSAQKTNKKKPTKPTRQIEQARLFAGFTIYCCMQWRKIQWHFRKKIYAAVLPTLQQELLFLLIYLNLRKEMNMTNSGTQKGRAIGENRNTAYL